MPLEGLPEGSALPSSSSPSVGPLQTVTLWEVGRSFVSLPGGEGRCLQSPEVPGGVQVPGSWQLSDSTEAQTLASAFQEPQHLELRALCL